VDFIQVFGKMELHPALLQTARHKRQHPRSASVVP
jgi:hypothetical protein